MSDPQSKRLAGRRMLVTGATSGIGRATALAAANAGAAVVINFLSDHDEAERMVKHISERGGRAISAQADISKPDQCERLFATVEDELGGLDVLVANAGIQRDAPFTEMTLDDWNKVVEVNLTGQFLCAQAAVRLFRRQGHGAGRSAALGNIIFTSSVHQVIPWAGHVNYATSKGGLKLLMESMAQELAPEKIRVNAVAPGAIKTDINRDAWENQEATDKLLKLIPYGRVGEPDDVAKVAIWLASDESDYVVGTTIFVDGGMLLYPGFREGG